MPGYGGLERNAVHVRQGDVEMLVLSRKKNEKIRIKDDITVVVVEIRGDKVRLGIDAPKEVPVHREEVYVSIRQDGRRKSDEDSKG
jgi:carbon storage regulator